MHNVTPRQLQVLQYIRDYRKRQGYSPTMQEIGDQLGLTKVTAFEHVGALQKKGLIHREGKYKARSLQVSPDFRFPDEGAARFPLVGRIAAGSPIEAIEDRQTLDMEEVFDAPGERFVLKVAGDSMVQDHICDGDFVVCRKTDQARNGETVVALLPEGEATLKRFYRERGRIRLQPANPNYQPLYVSDVQIQGVVIGVLRRL